MSTNTDRKVNKRRTDYIAAIVAVHGGSQKNYSRKELRAVSDAHGWKWIPNWITHDQSRRVSRGVFSIPEAYIMPEENEGADVTPTQEELDSVVAEAMEKVVSMSKTYAPIGG